MLFKNHFEKSLPFLMPFEVLSVGGALILSIASFEIGAITLDIVEHILMLTEELGRVGAEQLDELGNLGASEEYRVLTEKLARIIERLQLGKGLIVSYP